MDKSYMVFISPAIGIAAAPHAVDSLGRTAHTDAQLQLRGQGIAEARAIQWLI